MKEARIALLVVFIAPIFLVLLSEYKLADTSGYYLGLIVALTYAIFYGPIINKYGEE